MNNESCKLELKYHEKLRILVRWSKINIDHFGVSDYRTNLSLSLLYIADLGEMIYRNFKDILNSIDDSLMNAIMKAIEYYEQILCHNPLNNIEEKVNEFKKTVVRCIESLINYYKIIGGNISTINELRMILDCYSQNEIKNSNISEVLLNVYEKYSSDKNELEGNVIKNINIDDIV